MSNGSRAAANGSIDDDFIDRLTLSLSLAVAGRKGGESVKVTIVTGQLRERMREGANERATLALTNFITRSYQVWVLNY